MARWIHWLLPAALLFGASALRARTDPPTVLEPGAYWFVEDGVSPDGDYTALGILHIAAKGEVTGRQFVLTEGEVRYYDFAGTVRTGPDSFLALSLKASACDDEDAAPEPRNYRVVVSASGGILAIRTDPGVIGMARLLPARMPDRRFGLERL